MNLRPLILCVILSASANAQQGAPDTPPRKGGFTGDLLLSPVGDGIHMKVKQAISYNDGDGHTISVPGDFVTDGASIPRALWSIVGSPFSGGNYVEAAVIHDKGCVSHEYSWEVTHLMFYTAMLDSGVSEHQAKLLYYGVRFGGPKWKKVKVPLPPGVHASKAPTRIVPIPSNTLTRDQVAAFNKQLTASEAEGKPLTVDQIDERTPFEKP